MSEKQTPPTEEFSAPLTDHSYDGIREYDNPLPGWWTWLFIGTIVFSVVYFYIAVFSENNILSAVTAYNEDAAADAERQFGSRTFTPDAKTLVELSHDPAMLKLGEGVFKTNCAICHGPNGEGLTCPDLTDDYYIHVKKIDDIVDVVSKGRKNGSMPRWEERLRPNEIVVVSAYVASLRGKNLPSPRPHEGTIPPPWTDK